VFTYDGDGKKVKQTYTDVSGTLTTYYYAGGSYEIQSDGTTQTVKQYYSIGGSTVAVREGSTFSFFLLDHLGSVVGVTDSSGALIAETRYLPFGQVRTDVGTIPQTDYGYTFQQNVDATGLMDYDARFYDPLLGRFVQADTVVPGIGKSQAFNRYAYTNNNPVKYTDPSGHCISGAVADTIFCVFVVALVGGAIVGGVKSAVDQQRETGHIDLTQVVGDALGGTVLAGAPLVVLVAAPSALSTIGYATWSTGQTIGNPGLSNIGVNQFAAGLQLSEFYSNPFPIVAPKQPTSVQTAPDFVVKPNGDTIAIPDGSEGPFLADNGKGFKYINGQGGKGLSSEVSGVRIMDPTNPNSPSPGYPNGYESYFNDNGNTIHPYTGNPIPRSSPWWHIALSE
jgi:RHS repeat-associated protein